MKSELPGSASLDAQVVQNRILPEASKDGGLAAMVIAGVGLLAVLLTWIREGSTGLNLWIGAPAIVFLLGTIAAFFLPLVGRYAMSPVEIRLSHESIVLYYPSGREESLSWGSVSKVVILRRIRFWKRKSSYLLFHLRKTDGTPRPKSPGMLVLNSVAGDLKAFATGKVDVEVRPGPINR